MVDVYGVCTQHELPFLIAPRFLLWNYLFAAACDFWWEDNCKWLTCSGNLSPSFPTPQPPNPGTLSLVLSFEALSSSRSPPCDRDCYWTLPMKGLWAWLLLPDSLGFSVSTSCWFCELKSANVAFIAFKSETITDNSRKSPDFWHRFKHDRCRPIAPGRSL